MLSFPKAEHLHAQRVHKKIPKNILPDASQKTPTKDSRHFLLMHDWTFCHIGPRLVHPFPTTSCPVHAPTRTNVKILSKILTQKEWLKFLVSRIPLTLQIKTQSAIPMPLNNLSPWNSQPMTFQLPPNMTFQSSEHLKSHIKIFRSARGQFPTKWPPNTTGISHLRSSGNDLLPFHQINHCSNE